MLLEDAAAITTSGIFSEAGEVMTGLMTTTGNFFSALWNSPMGKVVIGLSVVSGAIGLAYKLYLRRKHV